MIKKQKETKAQNPIKSTLATKKTDSLVIDLESLLVPMSILISGLMISLSIIFSFRGTTLGAKDTSVPDTTTPTTDTAVKPTDNDGTGKTVGLDDDPYLGDKSKAKVAIVEFSDYECPYCKRHFQQVYPEIYNNYIKTGKIIYVFRDLPLSFHEPVATNNAMAAQCVFAQKGNEAYFKMHDAIFTASNSNSSNMTVDILKGLAKKISGVNYNTFVTCMNKKTYADEIKNDAADAAKVGISGTPGFIIGKISSDGKTLENGTFLGGAYPYDNFKTAIEEALK